MKNSDWAALDIAVAIAMGCIPEEGHDLSGDPLWKNYPGLHPAAVTTFCPTRRWEDFGAALLWAGTHGRTIDIRRWKKKPGWQATLNLADRDYASGQDSDPRVALCKAIVAWNSSANPGAGRGAM